MDVDLQFVEALTLKARQLALEMVSEAQHEVKTDQTYVTNVDRYLERFLEDELNKRYPDFGFFGEEYGLRGSLDAPFWAVDPIDGTTNLVLGLPLWCVSVGLVYQNELQLGVVSIPRVDELYSAKKGEGARCNGSRITARDSEIPHQEDPLCVTTRGSKHYDLQSWPGSIRSLGSIASELAYVASGAMSGMVGYSRTLYDVAAGWLIAREAGCELTYMDGEPIDMMDVHHHGTKTPFVVAPPMLTEWLINNLKEG